VRKKIVVGNWKMNLNKGSASALIRDIKSRVDDFGHIDVGIAPPFVYLPLAVEMARNTSLIISAQNCYPKSSGAYTGEISPSMLSDIGVKMCIVGHSERRQYFSESDDFISEKVRSLLDVKINPILCVGETLEERENNKIFDIIEGQMKNCLSSVKEDDILRVLIAYEPVWAIGTGRNATPEQAEEVHKFIRSIISDIYDDKISEEIRIMYGGSVNPSNAYNLMSMKNIDGALVGGASIKSDDFCEILNSIPR